MAENIKMEPRMDATWKNIASITKELLSLEQTRLKKFTIPKKTPDKDFLKECSTNQREYNEIKQRLSQCCLDTKYNFDNFWQPDKVKMVQNKCLEEDFVAKRAKLREEGRQDKELSCFLAVSKEEVSNICQGGLHIGHTKKELNVMKQLGNPQFGVYLFRYVDIALRFASQHSHPVENIIIFRVLLGKVKKIQTPKDKKKVALDPTPNFDCHMSRIHPSAKDSLEEQAIGSLIYFYEYNGLSKPVDKPRQCLPYAVIKVRSGNQKMSTGSILKSLKYRPKMLPKHVGRGLPLENCTRVTRIGNDQLIYEHFRKPVDSYALNSEHNTSDEVSPFSGDIQNWSSSIAETLGRKMKQNSTRNCDLTPVKTDELALQYSSNTDVYRDVRSDYIESKIYSGVYPIYDSALSTVITSRVIKDPRLTKREQNLGKQNGEARFSVSSQHENELEYNLEMKLSATTGIPYTMPEDSFLFNSSNSFSQRLYTDKTWKENIPKENISPFLSSDKKGLGIIDKEILPSRNTNTEHALENCQTLGLLKSKEYRNNLHKILVHHSKEEKGIMYSEIPLPLLNPFEIMEKQKCQNSQPDNKKHITIEPSSCEVTDICTSRQKLENETSISHETVHEMADRKDIGSQLEDDESCTFEGQCRTDINPVIDKCTLSEGKHIGEIQTIQNHILKSGICENIVFENIASINWHENNWICQLPSDENDAENFEQNNLSQKVSIPEMSEKDTEVACEDLTLNIQDLKITDEFEKALGEYTKSLSVPEKLCNYENMTDEKDAYHYLLGRMDWDNLFIKENLNTEILGNHSQNRNRNMHFCRGHPSVARKNPTLACPDLQITVTNSSQSELNINIGKCAIKYSGPKNGMKWLQEKTMKKCAQSKKTCKLYKRKKELSICCSSFSKGQLTKIAQSEKHIKNILNIPNRKTFLHKNKFLSQKIGGAIIQLRKAQKRVQPFKTVSKAGRRNLSDLSKTCEVLHCGSPPSDSSVMPGSPSGMPCNNDSVRNTTITGVERMLEKSANLDSMPLENDMSTNSDGPIMTKEQKSYETCIKQKVKTTMRSTKENLKSDVSSYTSKNIAKCLDSTTEQKELLADERKDEGTCKSDVKTSTVKFVTSVQTTVESSVETNALQPDGVSMILENDFSSEGEVLGIFQAQESICINSGGERYAPSFLHVVKNKYEPNVHQSHLPPKKHDAGSLPSITVSNSSNELLKINFSRKQTESFSRQPQEADKIMKHSVQESEDMLPPMSLAGNNLLLLSHHCSLPEHEKKTEESGVLEIEKDLSHPKLHVMNDTSLKSLIFLEQRDTTQASPIMPSKESACRQITSNSISFYSSSPLSTISEQNVEAINANSTLSLAPYDAKPNKTNHYFIFSGTRESENTCSGGYYNNYRECSSEIKCTQIEVELKCLDFKTKMSEVLQKVDKTSSLNLLHDQIIFCRDFLPFFIKAFEKKQDCSVERVLVSKVILGNMEKNMALSCKLNSSAIESFVELQIIMEAIEFIENKKRLMGGEPTFRSLLWYDDSLCSELFGGQSGNQQQSNFYHAFQRRIKYNALNELQSYHKQLVDIFEKTRRENNSYYTFLKSRREIKECEAAMKSDFCCSDFFLSVPYVCGANYGDTLEDLEDIRKSTVDLINVSKSLPRINLNAEKEDNFWVILEIIATKIEFIKTCEEVNIKTSLFGLEHIFFDAAKSLMWKEREKSINKNSNSSQMSNETAFTKFYETYEHTLELIASKSAEECSICENGDEQQKASPYIRNSLILPQDICCIGEILDEAQSANIERLQQLMFRCTEHMEMLKKYFQILQEEDVSVLITKENVLGFMKNGGITPVVLKPEAIEVYTEMAMIYETVFYLKNSIARKVNQPRFRSLLWFDLSLLPELFRCQERMVSFSYQKDNLLKITENTISELQDELDVIYEYPENVNCPYALHLISRELAELSETRNLLKTSKTPISMCVDLVPYSICLNYGNTVSELECNYNQFSSLLEKLMLAERKDLGKMAHIMKIMKTIEHMKFICFEQRKSPLPLVIHQMLKNWRKACQLKKHLKSDLDANAGYDNKDSSGSYHTLYKRPIKVTSEDGEKNNLSHSKKKKSMFRQDLQPTHWSFQRQLS